MLEESFEVNFFVKLDLTGGLLLFFLGIIVFVFFLGKVGFLGLVRIGGFDFGLVDFFF